MELYFLRHAIAGERSAKYKDDSKRPLTTEGRRKMAKNALGIKALDIPFDALLSSPYTRAKQTAEIARKVLKIKKSPHLTKNLVPEAAFEELILELRKKFPKSKHVLLVGHEPHMSHCISFLLTPGQQISVEMKKGGLCCLGLAKITGPGGAKLNWLLTPLQLRLMAGA